VRQIADGLHQLHSIRRLAELRPALARLGHGPVFRDPAKLAEFAAGLP